MKKLWIVMLVLAAVSVQAVEMTVHPSAKYGGNYMVSLKYSDFTESSTNTAQAFTFTVPANTGYELLAMELVTAFDTGNTNYTGSVAVKVGDGTDDDLYLPSTELASDGTEVYASFNAGYSTAVTVTAVTTNLVYLNASSNATTNAVMVSATAVASPGTLGRKVYTSADTIDFTFTPNTEEALDDNTSGEVYFYFREI